MALVISEMHFDAFFFFLLSESPLADRFALYFEDIGLRGKGVFDETFFKKIEVRSCKVSLFTIMVFVTCVVYIMHNLQNLVFFYLIMQGINKRNWYVSNRLPPLPF